MMSYSSAPRSVLLAGAFFGAFTFGAAAQQPAASPPAASPPPAAAAPAAAPLPPGSPLMWRPASSEAAPKPAPNAPPPIPAPPYNPPSANAKGPAGCNIAVNALGIPHARPMLHGITGRHDHDPAKVRRINLDGSGAEVIAKGVRNTVGFDWNPETKQLYFTDNGRDWMSEDVPEDELNRVTKVGEHFGAPYCLQGNIPDPEFGWGHSCSEFTPPVGLMGPHAGTLGMRFYTGNMFPKSYKNAIIAARHGSWNRS